MSLKSTEKIRTVSSIQNYLVLTKKKCIKGATEEIHGLYNFSLVYWYVPVALLEISRNSLLTRVAGSQFTICNGTKNRLLTKFPKGLLEIL